MAEKVGIKFGTAGSTVAVLLTGTSTPALLYSDVAENQPLSNPVTVTPNGWVLFHVGVGTYDLVESGNGTAKQVLAVGSGAQDGDLLVFDAASGGYRALVPLTAIAAPSGGLTPDSESRTAINDIRAALTSVGITL